jgi:exopolysaccharide production protein ExoZ
MPNQPLPVKRIEALDYLRGLAALGIMVYHLCLFSFGESDASSFLAKVKIYAIAIFFVLSGMALFVANEASLKPNSSSIGKFYLKRFFRIFPLLWLATAFTYLLKSRPEMFTFNHLIANITILPGIIRPEAFEANGAWSIGDELFFYACFPVLFFLQQKRQVYLVIMTVISFIVFCLFTFKWLNPTVNLGFQWSVYVSPFNHFFYFVVGILIATLKPTKTWIIGIVPWLLLACLIAVIYYPISGEPVVLVTGVTRLFFALATIIICYCFYVYPFNFLPVIVKKWLLYLGKTSYSIYLLHPLLYLAVSKAFASFMPVNVYFVIVFTICITILISGIFYQKFELYFINLGKSIISKKPIASIKNTNL